MIGQTECTLGLLTDAGGDIDGDYGVVFSMIEPSGGPTDGLGVIGTNEFIEEHPNYTTVVTNVGVDGDEGRSRNH